MVEDLNYEWDPEEDEEDPDRGNTRAVGRVVDEEKAARERAHLIEAITEERQDRLIERVAYILNKYPESRDSDIALQFRYWKQYDSELYEKLQSDLGAMYSLPRLTSLSRARARIQNTHRLFLASMPVRSRRRLLSEEQRDRFINPPDPDPILTIYADESGKNDKRLVVGSVWILDPFQVLQFTNRVSAWRASVGFDSELHFKRVNAANIDIYKQFVDLALDTTSSISFKSISVGTSGIRDVPAALDLLYVALMKRGVKHEDATGRAPLPRRVQIWKDAEEEGKDRVLAARITDVLAAMSTSELENRLRVDSVAPVDSKTMPGVQLADLYTSSLNRTFNRSEARKPRDDFADFLLGRLREGGGDLEIHMEL
jgi:hypothetical protein